MFLQLTASTQLQDTGRMSEPTIIAILGAECTGKSSLAQDLGAALAASGHDVAVVPEYLRVFCDTHGRTPRVDEQRAIARAQTARIQAAAARHALVLADTTALVTAVYSDLVFGDASLYDESVLAHLACRVNLLTATDIPWVADGIQRDGPHARERVDGRLRSVLLERGLPFSVLVGDQATRVQSALRTVLRCTEPAPTNPDEPRWRWVCAHCGDAACEAAALERPR